MRLGVAPGRHATTVAAVRDGVLLESWSVGTASGTEAGAGTASGAGDEVRAACVAVDLDGVERAPVAAIRVGGPCPPVLGPQVTHPDGAATIVRGGHSLTGRPLAPLDVETVRRFAAGCGLSDFAVTATGSRVLADHELAVAEIVAAEVPGARITLSYEFGRPGLRERERSAMLNAALGPAAARIAAEVARTVPGLPLYFARTGRGLVSAHYFRRYPLVCRFGATAGAARGQAALSGRRAEEAEGVNNAADGVSDVAEHAAAEHGSRAPESVAAFVVAFGAALAQPMAGVERIVQARGRAELDRALGDARDEALTRVVSAGAAPGSARIAATTVNPLSYLPDGLYRVRVRAEGATP